MVFGLDHISVIFTALASTGPLKLYICGMCEFTLRGLEALDLFYILGTKKIAFA